MLTATSSRGLTLSCQSKRQTFYQKRASLRCVNASIKQLHMLDGVNQLAAFIEALQYSV